ncbi:hypothetical protein F5884DRAFT_643417, partial [Xylogone sp. PMI_703]
GSLRQIFAGNTISVTGDFGANMSHSDIARWITIHGGTFVSNVTGDTTILISTVDEYKRRSSQVRKALKRGRACTIVSIRWLIDCLPQSDSKKRFMPPKKYTLSSKLKNAKKANNDPSYCTKYGDSTTVTRQLVDPRLHDIYADCTGFKYEVKLHRYENEARNLHERYTLCLFQSRAVPHTYMAGAKFNKGRAPTVFYRDLMCKPKTFDDAFQDFKRLFKNKTGVPWDQRLEKREGRKDTEFAYEVPKLGRPIGELPEGYIIPEEWKFE